MKKFLIIGNMNAVTYKEIFPLIKDNKVWLGTSTRSMSFKLPTGDMSGVNVRWFTNLEHNKRHEPLYLVDSYQPEVYPKYDNYDAIEVSKVVHIPKDYEGVMGVPISFLDKYCPEQFEIVGGYNYSKDLNGHPWNAKVNGEYVYKRILIRNKKPEKKIKSFKEFVKDGK